MNCFQAAKATLSALALAAGLALPAHAALVSGEPQLSVGDVSLAEGNAGSSSVYVRFSLSTTHFSAVRIVFHVSSLSASLGADYTTLYAASGDATIAAGDTAVDVQIADILGDLLVEPDETFTVNIGSFSTFNSPESRVSLLDSQALVTIVNDDEAVASAVPEPGSAALVGLALAGALVARRRRS